MAKERIRLIYPENPILVCHELEKGTSNSDGWFSRIRDMVRDHIASKRFAARKTMKRRTLLAHLLPEKYTVRAWCVTRFQTKYEKI